MSSDEVQPGAPEVAPQDASGVLSTEKTDVPAAVAAEPVPAEDDTPAMEDVLRNSGSTDIGAGEAPPGSAEDAAAPETQAGAPVPVSQEGEAAAPPAAAVEAAATPTAEREESKGRARTGSGSTAPGPLDSGVKFSSVITTGSGTDTAKNNSGTTEPPGASPPPTQQPQPRLSTAPRSSVSGRQVIAAASNRADTFIPGVDSTGNSRGAAVPGGNGMTLNAQYKTVPEEHAEYRARNKISSSYRGPVYVVEDTCVACHACGGPVDPVRRVPVGTLFFHENCVHCYLCGRRTGVAGLYLQVDRQAVCSDCAGRGYDRWVPRQEAQSRNMIYGAIKGDVYAALDEHDRTKAQRHHPRRLIGAAAAHQQQRRVAGLPITAGPSSSSTLNKATVPGALPPTLAITNVHNRRNTGARSFALMERQQYYTQSDNNMLMTLPSASAAAATATPTKGGAAHSRGSTAGTPQYRIADRQ